MEFDSYQVFNHQEFGSLYNHYFGKYSKEMETFKTVSGIDDNYNKKNRDKCKLYLNLVVIYAYEFGGNFNNDFTVDIEELEEIENVGKPTFIRAIKIVKQNDVDTLSYFQGIFKNKNNISF